MVARDPIDWPGGDPIDDPPPPESEEVPTFDTGPVTVAKEGKPLPTVYGTFKVPAILLEKAAPVSAVPPRRVASTAYEAGEYVTVLAYVVLGASSQDAVFLCTTGGTASGSADFSTAGSPIAMNSIYGPDGGCYWKLVGLGALKVNTQAILMGLCEGEGKGSLQMWWDKERVNALSLTQPGRKLTIQLGKDDLSQAIPSPFDSTTDYQHTMVVYGTAVPTGTEKEVPGLFFEVQGVMFGVATRDVNPADVFNDLLTHSRRGRGWPSGRVDSSVTGTAAGGFRVYCDALGIRLSMCLNAQRSVMEILQDILTATNSDAVWSGGKIKVIPLGDKATTSHVYGSTNYTPVNTSQYALGVDDFLNKDQPVRVERRADADCYNSWPIEYVHGASGSYQRTTVEDKEQANIDTRELWRAPTTVLPFSFPGGEVPVTISRILAQRSLYVRNKYFFRLSWRYIRLEPLDIVTLTEPEMGLNATPVRILSITEGEDYTIDVVAEDYPESVQGAVSYTPQAGDGYASNDKLTTAQLPTAVDGTQMTVSQAVIGAAAVIAGCLPDAAGTRSNFNNLWPNPSSEVAPPSGADESQPEWYLRRFTAPAWIATHAYIVGDTCTNGGKGYIVTTGGTSAGSGGPTGTGTNIVDGAGALRWDYVSSVVFTATPYSGNYTRVVMSDGGSVLSFPVSEGESVYMTAMGKKVSTGNVNVDITFLDARGNGLGGASQSSTSGSWTKLSAFATAPAGTVKCEAQFYGVSGAGNGLLFDALFVGRGVDPGQLTPGTERQVQQVTSGVSAWTSNLVQESWVAPTLAGTWVNYGGGYLNAGYYKDVGGTVHLRGMIKSGTIGTTAFTLPSGYRPSATCRFVTESNSAHGICTIDSSGVVTPAAGNNAWFSLDGITFDTR